MKNLQRQQFSFMKTSFKVSLKFLRHVSLSISTTLQLPGVRYFSRRTRGKKITQSFLFTVKVITRYSSERFLSVCGEKMSEGFLKCCKLMSNLIVVQIIVSNFTNVHNLAALTTFDSMKPEKKNKSKHQIQ